MVKLRGLILVVAVVALVAFLARTPQFEQAVTQVQQFSLTKLDQAITNISHTELPPDRWSMFGVLNVLIFFRLRRKHQVTLSSTRLIHDQRWMDSRTMQSADPVHAVRLADSRLGKAMLHAGVSDAADQDVEATVSV